MLFNIVKSLYYSSSRSLDFWKVKSQWFQDTLHNTECSNEVCSLHIIWNGCSPSGRFICFWFLPWIEHCIVPLWVVLGNTQKCGFCLWQTTEKTYCLWAWFQFDERTKCLTMSKMVVCTKIQNTAKHNSTLIHILWVDPLTKLKKIFC